MTTLLLLYLGMLSIVSTFTGSSSSSVVDPNMDQLLKGGRSGKGKDLVQIKENLLDNIPDV